MAAAGYAGTELGDWGFLPTDPAALAADVGQARLALVGAFVPVALARADAIDEGHRTRGADRDTCWPMLRAGPSTPRCIVLSDDNATVPNRTARAGRIRPRTA